MQERQKNLPVRAADLIESAEQHEKQGVRKNEKTRAYLARCYESARNSYSSITAATAILPAGLLPSTRTTRPLQRTRMLSVSVISGGRVSVKSIAEPAWMAEST